MVGLLNSTFCFQQPVVTILSLWGSSPFVDPLLLLLLYWLAHCTVQFTLQRPSSFAYPTRLSSNTAFTLSSFSLQSVAARHGVWCYYLANKNSHPLAQCVHFVYRNAAPTTRLYCISTIRRLTDWLKPELNSQPD